MKLYMAVTADEYELPLCVEDSTTGLATWLGITTNAVLAACTPRRMGRNRRKCGYRIIRVETEEKESVCQDVPVLSTSKKAKKIGLTLEREPEGRNLCHSSQNP